MIIYLSWNNYDSFNFICIIVTADLCAFKETIYWTWDQKNDLWYLAQNFVVTLVFSGNKFQTLQPLASKTLFFFFFFQVQTLILSLSYQFSSYHGNFKPDSWMKAKCWFPFTESLAQLSSPLGKYWCKKWPGRKPCIWNLCSIHGKIIIWPTSNKNTFV